MKKFLALLVFLATGLCTLICNAQEGERIYRKHCSWCHDPGMNNPGTQQLTKTRGKANGILIERDNLVDVYVKTIVRQGLNAMPAFKPTQITESELGALAAFLAE
jgi:mono/diheme cytochrome c family protein